MKGTFPTVFDHSATILCCFTRLAVAGDHRIDAARKVRVAREYAFAHALVSALGPQSLELVVEVEYQRGLIEAARRA